jgi:hypothetical protein
LSSDAWDDPELEAQWLAEQRGNVVRYLQDEAVPHSGVASRPTWFIAPFVSVWAVTALGSTDGAGWWCISGDLPTDYTSAQGVTDARSALAVFARRWREAAAYMLRGEKPPGVRIGSAGDGRELGDLLDKRAQILEEWVHDEGMWEPS